MPCNCEGGIDLTFKSLVEVKADAGEIGSFPVLIKISELKEPVEKQKMVEDAVNRYNLLNGKTPENKVNFILSGYKNNNELNQDSCVKKFNDYYPAAYRYYTEGWKVKGVSKIY